MSGDRRGGEAWGRLLRPGPEWAQATEVLVESCMAPPSVPAPIPDGLTF